MSAAQDTIGMRLLVADSFRVRKASGVSEARGFRYHFERFTVSVAATYSDAGINLPQRTFDEYIADAIARIAAYGEGNPRLELWGAPGAAPEFKLSLRPLPELRHSIEMRSVTGVPTTNADRKGPNIGLLTSLNQAVGAEALLTESGLGDDDADNDASLVLEGATTAIVWWDGEQGHVASSTVRVASITEKLVSSIADEHGTPLTPSRITPIELADRETWAVNALHGIRPVTSIDGVKLPAPDPHRLRMFREALDRTWTPVA